MALIPYADPENMPNELRKSIELFEKMHDRPTLVRRMAAHYGPLLRAIGAMYPSFMEEGKLSQKITEMMFVSASTVHDCKY